MTGLCHYIKVSKYDTLMQADEKQFTPTFAFIYRREISIYRSVQLESCIEAVICVALCSACVCAFLVVNLSSTHPAVVLIELLREL